MPKGVKKINQPLENKIDFIPRTIIMDNPINTSSKCYNVVLPSSKGTTTGIGATNLKFNFDWGVLPNQPYKVYFTFCTTAITNSTDTFVNGLLQTDLFYTATQYIGNATKQHASNTDVLGIVQSRISNNSTSVSKIYYFADKSTNTPLYISERPRSNEFQIFFSDLSPGTANTEFYVESGKYTLILHFEPLH